MIIAVTENGRKVSRMSDLISRQAAIEEIRTYITKPNISDDELEIKGYNDGLELAISVLSVLPSAQPERLTNDDFETIRIHLSAYKEKLCNQRRWKEAEEYQKIIDRFMSFASEQPERKKGEWVKTIKHYKGDNMEFDFYAIKCSACGEKPEKAYHLTRYCPNCGAYMR